MMETTYLDEVDSTLSEARRWIHAGRSPGFALVAKRQTAGRGRFQRQWILQEGNLALTICVPWKAGLKGGGTLPLLQGLALHRTVSAIVGSRAAVALKWPNDLMLDGAKASGTLIEAASGALFIGSGVNVAYSPQGLGVRTAHLEQFVDQKVDVRELAASIIANWESLYAQWQEYGFNPFLTQYNSLLYNLNRPTRIWIDRDKQVGHQGINRGVDTNGALLLEDAGVVTAHFAGDLDL